MLRERITKQHPWSKPLHLLKETHLVAPIDHADNKRWLQFLMHKLLNASPHPQGVRIYSNECNVLESIIQKNRN